MLPEGTTITPASSEDLAAILALLEGAHLPTIGITRQFPEFPHFLVARRGGPVIGSAGLEIYGDAALLRSVAVADETRGQGMGVALTQAALDHARGQGVRMAYLLTLDAAEFFGRKFGFAALPPEAVDPRLEASSQFRMRRHWPPGVTSMVRPLAEAPALSLRDRVRWALAGRTRQVVMNHGLTPSAVLLLLYEKDGAPHVLFTRRTSLVEDHKGEVSFPGGAFHHGEDTSLLVTALRESHEEVGVAPGNVEVLGGLDDTTPRSRYIITPYVGMLREPQVFQPSATEVAEVLEVPLAYLQDPANHRDGALEPITFAGREITGEYVAYGDAVVWGATYRILRQFLDLMQG